MNYEALKYEAAMEHGTYQRNYVHTYFNQTFYLLTTLSQSVFVYLTPDLSK